MDNNSFRIHRIFFEHLAKHESDFVKKLFDPQRAFLQNKTPQYILMILSDYDKMSKFKIGHLGF
jgi:hypothetical protein